MPTEPTPDSVFELPTDFDWSPEAVLDYIDSHEINGTVFDLASGLWWFCYDYHGGHGCPLYSILSGQLDYSPGACEESPSEDDDEDPGRWFVYSTLVAMQGF